MTDDFCEDISDEFITVNRLEENPTDGIDLELSISVDNSSYDQYEEVAYTITVSNNGATTANDIVIAAGLPEGMVYTDDFVSQGDYNLFFEEWIVGTLAPGATAELNLTLFTLVEGVDIVNFVQVIEASGDDVDSTPDNNNTNIPTEDDEASVTISEFGGTGAEGIDLEVSIAVDENTYDIYEDVTYTIQVVNEGTTTATDIVIAAGLPEGMVYTSSSTSTGEYNLFFEEWTIYTLEPGEVAELELVLFTLVENQAINQFVEVMSSNELDDDSKPGNGNGFTAQEDDEAAISIGFLEASVLKSLHTKINTSSEQMLYPNPARADLTLEFMVETAIDDATLQVYDIAGQLKFERTVNIQKGVNQFQLDINQLPAGNYFLRTIGVSLDQGLLKFVKIN